MTSFFLFCRVVLSSCCAWGQKIPRQMDGQRGTMKNKTAVLLLGVALLCIVLVQFAVFTSVMGGNTPSLRGKVEVKGRTRAETKTGTETERKTKTRQAKTETERKTREMKTKARQSSLDGDNEIEVMGTAYSNKGRGRDRRTETDRNNGRSTAGRGRGRDRQKYTQTKPGMQRQKAATERDRQIREPPNVTLGASFIPETVETPVVDYDRHDQAVPIAEVIDDDDAFAAELIREVLRENPPEVKGVREEWVRHEGVGRQEFTHESPVNVVLR